MKAAEYVDIGQYLRDSRESLHVPLDQAAHALHIRPKYLADIESGNLGGLPGKAYTRGYIKNYAHYLGLDPDEVLEAYESLLSGKGQEFFIPEPTLAQNQPSKNLLYWSLAGLILLYAYWYNTVYDNAPIMQRVANVPAHFLQYLDKNTYAAMDKGWEHCLQSTDNICFVRKFAALDMHIEPVKLSYDKYSDQFVPTP